MRISSESKNLSDSSEDIPLLDIYNSLLKLDNINWNKEENFDNFFIEYKEKVGIVESILKLKKLNCLDLFYLLFPVNTLGDILRNTNSYFKISNSKQTNNYKKIKISELKAFLGINIAVRIKKYSSIKDYWSLMIEIKDFYLVAKCHFKDFKGF
ncbi:hypothetical protein BB559_000014 [Furculomyces boomerangus]|uniref:PiggyBac transposable element-derived protein domain-containing protein n=1 Tax=Furculomyces boomerangus TaxID=61424 RepID=A0A2T9Z6J7_9FUNG|nr:hypothetical protein BB559_000014 [Furculomyces boomerangus]